MDPVLRLSAYLDALVRRPIAELNRAQRGLRFMVELGRHASRELRANDAGEMAAALTYRTIFGLVPLLMVSMLAFRMFGDMDQAARQLQVSAYSFFNYQVDPSRPEAAAFKSALDEKIFDVMRSVSGLSFSTIGAVGALLLIWAALGLLVSFEDAANRIYRAPRGRRWVARIGIYWTVLTLGPILLLVVLYAAQFWIHLATRLPVVGAAFSGLGQFASLAGSFLAMSLLYKLLPNTLVKWRPALVGAFISAALWDLTKWGFGLYVSRALPYMKLYGALGLIPLFLFWLYVNWLIVLFGMEIAFTLQAMRGRIFERPDTRGALSSADPQWFVPLVAAIARASREGQPASRQGLAEELKLRLESVNELLCHLEDEKLVVQTTRTGSDDVGVMLALPPERIPLARLVALASRFTLGDTPRQGPGWGALAWLYDAAREAAGERTVADVV
ncbi:MAG TPA: YihY/virulence factor BrkB family protein [Vicinamibacteria bacterium]|nr:YihY/virulence factor BrkB family protein [Vicinamibacteria bacterium]